MTLPDTIYTDVSPYRSSNLLDTPAIVFPRASGWFTHLGALASPVIAGTSDFAVPVVDPDEYADGVYVPTFFDDWYYRIHLNPLDINLGNLAGDQQRTVRLWNAFLTPVDVSAVELVNGDGISFTADYPLPGTLPALQLVTYSITISSEGPPVVDADLVWTIDGIDYTVSMEGRRAVFFGISPNWGNPYRETLEWMTVISRSYSGVEQRSAMRPSGPRARYEFQIREFNDDAKLFDMLTFGWQARMFAVPMWNERAYLAADVAIGDTSFTVNDTTNTSLMDGQTVVIMSSATEYELGQIDTVVGNTINLLGPFAMAWAAGTRVYPCSTSKLSQDLSTTRQLPTHVDALLSFAASPTDSGLRLPVVAAPATYRGEELYTGTTNWREPLQVRISASETLMDMGTGPFRLSRRANFPDIDRSFLFFAKDADAAEDLRAFFVRRQGRLTPLWMPSGTQDFVITQPTLAGDSFIRVKRTAYPDLINENPARRDLLIHLRNGTKIARRISDVAHDTATEDVVNLDAPLGTAFAPAQVKMVSFLGFYRLSSDQVTFLWHNDEVAEVTTSFTLTEPTE